MTTISYHRIKNVINDNIRKNTDDNTISENNSIKNKDFNKLDINSEVESTIYKQFKENDNEKALKNVPENDSGFSKMQTKELKKLKCET